MKRPLRPLLISSILGPLTLAACAATAEPRALPSRTVQPPANVTGHSRTQADFRLSMLREHNRARVAFGSAPLEWDPALATEATLYAREMARTGRYMHSPRSGRSSRQGESIWRGAQGLFSFETIVGTITAERRYFRPGVFPNNSSTGNWKDVGHYTAMVWPATTHIGCGFATGQGSDWLVCRYTPPGNQDGVTLSP